MHSAKHQGDSASSAFSAPTATPRLTAEEWMMILEALRAYQHNQEYRALYEKLAARVP